MPGKLAWLPARHPPRQPGRDDVIPSGVCRFSSFIRRASCDGCRQTQPRNLSSIYELRNRTPKGGLSTVWSRRFAQNQSRGRSAQNDVRPPIHRRRFFFTPTGTCAKPPPGVKIFFVSSDCAHTHPRPKIVGAQSAVADARRTCLATCTPSAPCNRARTSFRLMLVLR
jgi:hypothetical protein